MLLLLLPTLSLLEGGTPKGVLLVGFLSREAFGGGLFCTVLVTTPVAAVVGKVVSGGVQMGGEQVSPLEFRGRGRGSLLGSKSAFTACP